MRIEVIGNIASGKTTLAHLLTETITGTFENFQANPFWESFYQAPDVYSFETEITFTLQHYHQIKRNISLGSDFICDYSLILDLSYANVTLQDERHRIYIEVLKELQNEIGLPDVLVSLRCSEEELLSRIFDRGREIEKSIGIDYLRSLSKSINENIKYFNAFLILKDF